MDLTQYKGQWGGKIENGEEMWWSEPNPRLKSGFWARWFFRMDVRQHFILRFWDRAVREQGSIPIRVVDYGCGTGGTTLNFSSMIGQPILGVDIFETQLKIAREFNQKLGGASQFELLDPSFRIPRPDGSIDVIFSSDVLGHVPDIPKVLADYARALKQGGAVILFTESTYSSDDRSLMARLAKDGADMMGAVPEHISLFPREDLEKMFLQAGFEIGERFSANVGHFFFFPKDYVLLLKDRPGHSGVRRLAQVWNRISKITPFYPWPFQFLRLFLTHLFGRESFGTSYFYYLRKR